MSNSQQTTLINGQNANMIDVTDRGLLYGDGFFTTMRVRDNKVEHWPLHIERLSFSSLKLHFPAIDIEQLQAEIEQLIQQQPDNDGVIRLTITRGSGQRGYKAPREPNIQRILSWSSNLPKALSSNQKGVELSISETPYSINPALAGVKHLNRLEQVLAQEGIEENCFDSIMLADNLIIGGSKTNIYFKKNDLWLTPKVLQAGVDGTVRRWLLGTQDDFRQSDFGLEIVSQAQYCMVSNALIGMIPVTKIGQHRYDVFSGTLDLQQSFNQNYNKNAI